jgi:hypothetical protein
VFNLLGILFLIALVFFIFRAITLGSAGSAWHSMKNSGNQWQQRFNSQQQQQPPYYQPPQQPYNQTPYYQPPAGQEQSYGQGYQPQPPYYQPSGQPHDYNQPQPEYPEEMPPMKQ